MVGKVTTFSHNHLSYTQLTRMRAYLWHAVKKETCWWGHSWKSLACIVFLQNIFSITHGFTSLLQHLFCSLKSCCEPLQVPYFPLSFHSSLLMIADSAIFLPVTLAFQMADRWIPHSLLCYFQQFFFRRLWFQANKIYIKFWFCWQKILMMRGLLVITNHWKKNLEQLIN